MRAMRAIPAEKGAENFKLREVETTFGVAPSQFSESPRTTEYFHRARRQ